MRREPTLDIAETDRDALARLVSELVFRPVRPDEPLNGDIHGDEAQSVLERLCDRCGIDRDLFWSKVDFHATFFGEVPPHVPLILLFGWIGGLIRGPRPSPPAPRLFTADGLLAVLRACAAEQRLGG